MSLSIASLVLRRPLIVRPPTTFEAAYYAYQNALRNVCSKQESVEIWRQNLENEAELRRKNENAKSACPGASAVDRDLTLLSRRPMDHLYLLVRRGSHNHKNKGHVANSSAIESNSSNTDNSAREKHGLATKEDASSVENAPYELISDTVGEKEMLHEATDRVLVRECGSKMTYWNVGRVPVAASKWDRNLFYMKTHILAGRPEIKTPQDNLAKTAAQNHVEFFSNQNAIMAVSADDDSGTEQPHFIWVSRDEMPRFVSRKLYRDVEDLLAVDVDAAESRLEGEWWKFFIDSPENQLAATFLPKPVSSSAFTNTRLISRNS